MRICKEVSPPRDAVALDMGGELLPDGVGEDAVWTVTWALPTASIPSYWANSIETWSSITLSC